MRKPLYIGLMSGTSLDGVDAALVEFDDDTHSTQHCRLIQTHSVAYSAEIRAELISLHTPSPNELERTAVVANTLTHLYADAINALLNKTATQPSQITAIGCHGQTIRHRPELGFSLQICNPSLLAELTQIDVVADFRNRDIAAGGQGAPLVPAFHQAVFSHPTLNRVILNIGGIANLTYLPSNQQVYGFDSGPGNMLMDAWIGQHLQKNYDADGRWAASGQVVPELLEKLLDEPYFSIPPPKSTGRDLFNADWLKYRLAPNYQAQDVQRTLLELTASTIVSALLQHCPNTDEVYLCGGGAHNNALFQCLQQKLHPVKISATDDLGIHVNWVEAAAFAWLAKQSVNKQAGNLPLVTGAKGLRILGAIYAR